MSWALRKLSEPRTTLSTASPWRVRREVRVGCVAGSTTAQLCQLRRGEPVPPPGGDGRADEPGDDVEGETDGHDQHAWLDRGELEAEQDPPVGRQYRHRDGEHRDREGIGAQALGRSRRGDGEAEHQQCAYDL